MRNVVMTLALVGMLALLAAPVQAEMVTADGTTVFFDNFESGTVGNPPVAVIGTWGTTGTVDVANASPPGAFEGDQYLAYSGGAAMSGLFASTVTSGQMLHYELMINQPMWSGTPTNGAYIRLYGSDTGSGDIRLYLILQDVNGVKQISQNEGGVWSSTGLLWSPGVWQKYEIDYVAGAATYDLTVDGSSVTLNARSTGDVDELYHCQGSGATTYIDAVVPEPSTLVLLSMGLVGLLCYAWRKRK